MTKRGPIRALRRWLAAAACAALLVPGSLLADDAQPPATAPVAPAAMTDQGKAPAPAQTTPPEAVAPKPKAKPKPAPVRAAAAGSVTIQNFAFNPGTVNVNAGDTVTWTNQDSTAHTATGSGGSFNTGTLKKGQSASHTFAKAGTFAYICAIHPNMKGTVVVAGSTGSGAGSGGGSGGSGSAAGSGSGSASGAGTSSASPGTAAPTLPNTGLQTLWMFLIGAAFTASGAVLRRLAERRG